MPDLEMIEVQEVEAKIAVLSSQNDAQRRSVLEQTRLVQSANRIAERVAAALEGQLNNGSLPA